MIKAVAQATALVVAIVIGALALWQMREAVLLLAAALAVSAAISPTIARLRERGLRREWAIGVVILLGLIVVGLLLLLLGSQLLLELEQIIEVLPIWYDQVRGIVSAQSEWAATIALAFPSSSALMAQWLNPEALPELLMGLAARLTIIVVLVIGAVSLGAYWLIDQTRIERLWLSLLPLQARSQTRQVWIRVYHEVGLYVRGGLILAVVTSLLLFVAYTLLGLPGAMLLALFGGAALIVPVLGPILAVLPPLIVAATQAPATAMLTIAVIIGCIALVKGLVSPLLFHDGISVNPVLTIICIMALGEAGGIGLILLGPPLAAAIQTTVQALRSEALPVTSTPLPDAEALHTLHARLDAIAAEDTTTPQVQSLVARARELVDAVANAK
jgi:putative permease